MSSNQNNNSNTNPTDETYKDIFENASKYLQGGVSGFDLVDFINSPNSSSHLLRLPTQNHSCQSPNGKHKNTQKS